MNTVSLKSLDPTNFINYNYFSSIDYGWLCQKKKKLNWYFSVDVKDCYFER